MVKIKPRDLNRKGCSHVTGDDHHVYDQQGDPVGADCSRGIAGVGTGAGICLAGATFPGARFITRSRERMSNTWVNSFPAEIIVCDPQGNILEMNDTAISLYEKEGGVAMIGRNVFDHHEQPVRKQVQTMVKQRRTYIYTTEILEQKKLVCIAPWHENGEYAGFVLMVLDLPANMVNLIKG